MIRYSNNPGKSPNTLTDSPTSAILTTKDVRGLNDTDNDSSEDVSSLQDLDSEDNNE